jgi:hypothetical protein
MNNSRFFGRLSNFGITRIIFSADLLLAIIATLLFFIFSNYCSDIRVFPKLIDDIFSVFLTLITIVIAGFAIIVSFTDKKFIAFLKKAKVYENIIFQFEFDIYLIAIGILLSLLYKNFLNIEFVYFLTIFFFIYSLLAVLCLISMISRYGLQKGEFEELTSK